MPGRPRTTARRLQLLFERQAAVADELRRILPNQYDPCSKPATHSRHQGTDPRGPLWQSAVDGAEAAADYLGDLACCLAVIAEDADRNNAAAVPLSPLDDFEEELSLSNDAVTAAAAPAAP